jgi:hypothetical protein
VRQCASCGTVLRPIRDDGECFSCHVRGIGFTFVGGAFYGRDGFHTTKAEAIAEHVGEDNIRNGAVERMR